MNFKFKITSKKQSLYFLCKKPTEVHLGDDGFHWQQCKQKHRKRQQELQESSWLGGSFEYDKNMVQE